MIESSSSTELSASVLYLRRVTDLYVTSFGPRDFTHDVRWFDEEHQMEDFAVNVASEVCLEEHQCFAGQAYLLES